MWVYFSSRFKLIFNSFFSKQLERHNLMFEDFCETQKTLGVKGVIFKGFDSLVIAFTFVYVSGTDKAGIS